MSEINFAEGNFSTMFDTPSGMSMLSFDGTKILSVEKQVVGEYTIGMSVYNFDDSDDSIAIYTILNTEPETNVLYAGHHIFKKGDDYSIDMCPEQYKNDTKIILSPETIDLIENFYKKKFLGTDEPLNHYKSSEDLFKNLGI